MTTSQIQPQKVGSQAETGLVAGGDSWHRIVSHDEWIKARTALLAKEKASPDCATN